MTFDDDMHDVRFFHVMQRLYTIMNFTCSGVGDITFGQYSALLEVSEYEEGIPMRELEKTFDRVADSQYLISLLEDQELVRRTRNKADRRSYSCVVTTKGRSLISAIDEALAVAIIGTNYHLGEDDMAVLVARVQEVAALDPSRQVNTMLPAFSLVQAYRYHRSAARICSVVGLSPLQIALLCVMVVSESPRDVAYFADRTSIFESIVEFQLGYLVDRGLARFEGGYCIVEKGVTRLRRYFELFSRERDDEVLRPSSRYAEELGNLVCYLLYLFD